MGDGLGRGRGALFERLRKLQEGGSSQEAEPESLAVPPSLGRGRASLAASLIASTSSSEISPTPPVGRGRFLEIIQQETASTPRPPAPTIGRGRSILSNITK